MRCDSFFVILWLHSSGLSLKTLLNNGNKKKRSEKSDKTKDTTDHFQHEYYRETIRWSKAIFVNLIQCFQRNKMTTAICQFFIFRIMHTVQYTR